MQKCKKCFCFIFLQFLILNDFKRPLPYLLQNFFSLYMSIQLYDTIYFFKLSSENSMALNSNLKTTFCVLRIAMIYSWNYIYLAIEVIWFNN
jgi:hypothetical protein